MQVLSQSVGAETAPEFGIGTCSHSAGFVELRLELPMTTPALLGMNVGGTRRMLMPRQPLLPGGLVILSP